MYVNSYITGAVIDWPATFGQKHSFPAISISWELAWNVLDCEHKREENSE